MFYIYFKMSEYMIPCHLTLELPVTLITFTNDLDPDKAQQNVWPDLDLNV